MTISVNRIEPSKKKIRKSIALSLELWTMIDIHANRIRLNRSQVVEIACRDFMSSDKKQLIEEKKNILIKLAVIDAQIKNMESDVNG